MLKGVHPPFFGLRYIMKLDIETLKEMINKEMSTTFLLAKPYSIEDIKATVEEVLSEMVSDDKI